MGAVYTIAIVNIAVTGSFDGNDGLFHKSNLLLLGHASWKTQHRNFFGYMGIA
jgi:hypothetical protein